MIYKLFYILYNFYSKDGNYKNDMPLVSLWAICSVTFFCFIMLATDVVQVIIDPAVRGGSFPKSIQYALMLMSFVLYYSVFVFNKKYDRIYDKYKDDPFLNSKRAKLMGFGSIIMVILLPFIFALLKNKIYFGEWT